MPGASPTPIALRVRDLRKAYPRRGREPLLAVDGVGFGAEAGQVVGLLGPNGAGKTTTIKMVCGLIRPDAGTVEVCGVDARRRPRDATRHIAAVLEGNRNLYWRLTARENLLYFMGNRGRSPRAVSPAADALLERFDLADKRDALVADLSRGMQQKLAIAVAVLAGTQVLLLDEPTLGLDVQTGDEVRRLVRELADEGRTVLLSSHDMAVVQDVCERVVVIAHGRLVADERVETLLRLFATRAYDARLGAPLTAAQAAELRRAFPLVSVADDGLHVRLDLERGDDVYRFIDVLRRERTPMESLDRVAVRFEEVFRHLVNGEGPANGDGPARGAWPAGAADATDAAREEVARVG
ncbi:MAG: ABC transporter ATP-binding protein [Trueperaceae bacterium]|nr:ABC transporter ATP-binding protein [Trueperaceae bacterium]